MHPIDISYMFGSIVDMKNRPINALLADDDEEFNPIPRRYRVSFTIKIAFLLVFFLGISIYGYMILERRFLKNRFLMYNELAPVKLVPSLLPSMMVYDPKSLRSIDLSAESKRWLLINIWATWCPPCKEEMPSLEFLQQKLQGKLKIIALSVDDNIDVVKEFIRINNPSFKVLWDKNQLSHLTFNVDKYPETFLVSPDGFLNTQFSGPRDWSSNSAVDYFLNLVK
jgi:thiol-disulfide isomerase/thioredoxin